jgi:hypothetical protein
MATSATVTGSTGMHQPTWPPTLLFTLAFTDLAKTQSR